MRINHGSLKKHLEKIILPKRMLSPVLINEETIMFPFENDDVSLVISLNHHDPLVYFLHVKSFFSSMETPFFLKFKSFVRNALLEKIELKDDDNIVTFYLLNDEEFSSFKMKLTIEFIPLKPNLYITDENNNILEMYHFDKIRKLNVGDKYIFPTQEKENKEGLELNNELIQKHFESELIIRHKEMFIEVSNFINLKIKRANNKIKAINDDIKLANEIIEKTKNIDEIYTLGINLKEHREEIKLDGKIIKLDSSISILENINKLYNRSKKARQTILRSEENIQKAQEEISYFNEMKNRFETSSEKEASKIKQELGMIKKKKETKETPFNLPYKVNFNGTIIYFGRNANQNDYLSFVKKLDRDFYWLHIKDKSGAHLVIASKKPTEKELILASEISLLCSRAISGEVIYTQKKNVRRGHTLGEAILKNYSTIKINNISTQAKEIFAKAERLK